MSMDDERDGYVVAKLLKQRGNDLSVEHLPYGKARVTNRKGHLIRLSNTNPDGTIEVDDLIKALKTEPSHLND